MMRSFSRISLCVGLFLLGACSPSEPYQNATTTTRHFMDAGQQQSAEQQFAVSDPLEGMNRNLYVFNAQLDRYVLLPIVDGYTYVVPGVVRSRISHFFENIGEFRNFTNATLQANPEKMGTTLGRFMVNTTVGLLGTFDVASDMGLHRQNEDFGQTLGVWGVGPGAYIVLPFFGPSNVRDTVGTAVDLVAFSLVVPNDIEDETAYKVAFYGVQPVNMRYVNKFRYFESGSPFEYEFVRYGSERIRELQIQK